jgi:hypothetical protein
MKMRSRLPDREYRVSIPPAPGCQEPEPSRAVRQAPATTARHRSSETGGIFDSVDCVGIGQRRFGCQTFELPGMRRAVVPLVRGEVCRFQETCRSNCCSRLWACRRGRRSSPGVFGLVPSPPSSSVGGLAKPAARLRHTADLDRVILEVISPSPQSGAADVHRSRFASDVRINAPLRVWFTPS